MYCDEFFIYGRVILSLDMILWIYKLCMCYICLNYMLYIYIVGIYVWISVYLSYVKRVMGKICIWCIYIIIFKRFCVFIFFCEEMGKLVNCDICS